MTRPKFRSPYRVQRVTEHIWTNSLLWVWPFSGVRLSGFAGLVSSYHTPPCGNVLRLLWPLLTPARSPCMLPYRALPKQRPHVGQVSPDKDVIFHYTTAAFTLSPESRALLCCANLPGDWALYAVSVRRLIALHSGFLQTVPRGSALAFG